jgi:hypothetical protein
VVRRRRLPKECWVVAGAGQTKAGTPFGEGPAETSIHWFDRTSSNQAVTSLMPRERKARNSQRLTYLLPRSWGTVTSTCSVEELPPLSVQVIVIV